MADLDRVRVAAVLAADADLELRPGLPALLDGDAHQARHTALVDCLEGVAGQDLLLQVAADELALGVVAGEAEGGLGEVVGAEGEELGVLGDLARRERRAGDLDHGSELVVDLDPLLLLDQLGDRLELPLHRPQLVDMADQRDHDLGPGVNPLLLEVAGGLHDRPDLHPGDLRVEDREPDAAQPQHRVGL